MMRTQEVTPALMLLCAFSTAWVQWATESSTVYLCTAAWANDE